MGRDYEGQASLSLSGHEWAQGLANRFLYSTAYKVFYFVLAALVPLTYPQLDLHIVIIILSLHGWTGWTAWVVADMSDCIVVAALCDRRVDCHGSLD